MRTLRTADIEKFVFDLIADYVQEWPGCRVKKIGRETTFNWDLRADNLMLVEIVMATEKEFSVELPNPESVEYRAIGDLLGAVEKALSEGGTYPTYAPKRACPETKLAEVPIGAPFKMYNYREWYTRVKFGVDTFIATKWNDKMHLNLQHPNDLGDHFPIVNLETGDIIWMHADKPITLIGNKFSDKCG